mmetsp:Transcript_5942/g.6065  ORF Transcript_5942/g.6065 Transcript_5942/m.6065 type:complete len:1036 (-) Transcript_5942:339-3446(-)
MLIFFLMLIFNASHLPSYSLKMMKFKKKSMMMALSTKTGDIPLLVKKGKGPSFLFSSVNSLKGVGPKTVDILGQLGIISVADALFHFPTNIIDRRQRVLLSNITAGDVITTELTVISIKKGFSGVPHTFQCEDSEHNSIEIKYFYPKGPVGDMMWFQLSKLYKLQSKLIISGKVVLSSFSNALEIVNPDPVLSANEPKAVLERAFGVEPIYGLTQGLTNAKMRLVIEASLLQLSCDITDPPNDWMLPEVRAERQWPTLLQALQAVHTPSSYDCLAANSPARSRLAFDEFVAQFLHQIEKDQAKNINDQDMKNQLNYAVIGTGHYTAILEENLPFKLTHCQRTAMDEVWKSMAHNSKMSRLIQGDVGTGKTVVAIMAMLRAIEDGKQAAMLAPTEILAKQHYGVISKYFETVSDIAEKSSGMSRRLRVELITGNVKGKTREQLLADVNNGLIDVLVGTTALIGDVVADSFRSLGVVIIDEEQRFGVGQRDKLASRTNTIFTTATPIPRSLMLLLEDGYTVSTLITKPPSKRPIETVLLGSSATDKIIERISVHLPYKSKVFWVAPTLYPSDSAPGCSVMERYEHLSALFPGKVALLHGQLSSEEKQAAMDSFSKINSEISILVATTVVEVGVDVPESSICVIDRAENFGLSQLHQIRGRIGRGKPPPEEILEKCFCVLIYNDTPVSDNMNNLGGVVPEPLPTPPKLQILQNTSDGFTIAEADLRLRGPGDLFGIQQHGKADYRVASLMDHLHLLKDAQHAATQILDNNYPHISFTDDRVITLRSLFPAPTSAPTAISMKKKTELSVSTSIRSDKTSKASTILLSLTEEFPSTQEKISKTSVKKSVETNKLLIDMRISKRNFDHQENVAIVLIDCETSGLYPHSDRIIQFAAKVLGEPSVEVFSSYITPKDFALPEFITELTGITPSFLKKNGGTFEETWILLQKWLENVSRTDNGSGPGSPDNPGNPGNPGRRPIVVIAHNSPFDTKFLDFELRRNGFSQKPGDWTSKVNIVSFVDSIALLRGKDIWMERKKNPGS